MTDFCIQTTDLSKRYGAQLSVNQLDLNVPHGAVYGFLGPNGAGKTTTMKMLLGLVHPTGGSIRLLGKAMNAQNRLAILRDVGSLIESPSYYGHLTARENLEIIRSLRDLPKSEIDHVLSIVRLNGEDKKTVAHFSLGMKQRLGIATALMGEPKLLLLDEPTNGLDPAGIQEMRELIKSLPARYDMTVMVSSHLLSEIDQIADHVGVITHGELVFEDTLKALHARSARRLWLKTNNDERAAALLTQAQLTENGLLLPYLPDGEVISLTLRLASEGIGLSRLEQREKTLEDIFLDMTGRGDAL